MNRTLLPLLTAGCLAAVLLAGCSDDAKPQAAPSPVSSAPSSTAPTPAADDAGEVVEFVRSLFLAIDERRGDDFVALMSDDFCQNGFGAPCPDLLEHADQLFDGQPSIDIRSVTSTSIEDDTATVDLVSRVQGGLHATRVSLVRAGPAWQITDLALDTGESLPAPANFPLVDVSMTDYSFEFDPEDLASGVFAMRIRNNGAEPHELTIKRIDSSVTLKQALAEDVPPNVVAAPVASIPPLDPGKESILVLADQLPPGHYFIFCELEDKAGTNHLALGQAAEFTVRDHR